MWLLLLVADYATSDDFNVGIEPIFITKDFNPLGLHDFRWKETYRRNLASVVKLTNTRALSLAGS